MYQDTTYLRGGVLSLSQAVIDVYRTVIGFAGSLFVYQLVTLGEHTCLRRIADIGANSLGIYIISGFAFVQIYKRNVLMALGIQSGVVLVVLYSIFLVAATYLLTIFIKRIPVLKTLLLGIKP